MPAFERIYGHLFAAFLQPCHMIMLPLEESLRAQSGAAADTQNASLSPGTLPGTYLETLKVWTEEQSRFFRGMASAFQQVGERTEERLPGRRHEDDIDGLQDMMPLRLLGNVADKEMRFLFQSLEESLYCFKESQFFLPKSLILHLQKLVSSYPKAYRLAQRYEAMFRSTWDKALRKFAAEIDKGSGPPAEFKEFYNTYTRIFSKEFDQLLGSLEFIEVQNSFMSTNLDVILSMRKIMEARLEMFPYLPFVTGSEMASLEKTVHGHKRRLDSLERKMREMERRSAVVQESLELERLRRSVNGHEEDPARLLEVVK